MNPYKVNCLNFNKKAHSVTRLVFKGAFNHGTPKFTTGLYTLRTQKEADMYRLFSIASCLDCHVIGLPDNRNLRGTWLGEDDIRERQVHEAVLVVIRRTLHYNFDEFDSDLGQVKKKKRGTAVRLVYTSSSICCNSLYLPNQPQQQLW